MEVSEQNENSVDLSDSVTRTSLDTNLLITDQSDSETDSTLKIEKGSRPPKGILRVQGRTVDELPKDLKKLVKETKLPNEQLNAHFDVLLYVLHFATKKVWVSDEKSQKKNPSLNSKKSNQDAQKKATANSEVMKNSAPIVVTDKMDQKKKQLLKKRSSLLALENESFKINHKNPKDFFKSLQKAGKGAFGNVFAAKSVATNSMVAIKRMPHKNAKDKIANINEVKYMAQCNHPNIVKFISCYEWKDEFWLVMEFLEGGTLSDARAGHEFLENEISYVAKELLQALSYLHENGLVHRDLKSANIMMSVMGEIKLIDFGLSIEQKHLKKPSMVGSPHWMAPEMINRQIYSSAVDIWSFGVSLLELTNRNPPWNESKIKTMFLTATEGMKNPLTDPEKWSDSYKDFLSRVFEMDQFKRATAKELLQHPFLKQAGEARKCMRKILSEVFLQKALGLF